ncbi:MAG TPA: succinate dehydrogenase assembly factor 2 [Gammaproteobacteria bacterium]|nr:succinate dehydrogenase assembly factor 2 [Gammaproteobacteria bacterium]
MPEYVNNDPANLKWQCRRGMLELDLLLNNFIDNRVDTLTEDEKQVLLNLLTYPDQILLDLLLGNSVSSDHAIAALVDAIRSTRFTS